MKFDKRYKKEKDGKKIDDKRKFGIVKKKKKK